jgi:RNA polymerase sigma-70 factor (ECF subfamily)
MSDTGELPIDLETVYRQYHRRVFAWCSRILRNREDAEDVTQDAFVHILRKIDTFRGEAAFSSWMFRVVMNTAFMQLRRKRLPLSSLDEALDDEEGTPRPRNVLGVADSDLENVTARVDLDRAFSELPEGFKVVLLLHDVEEYTHAEIAEIRGWTDGTSKSQLHKARNRLRKLLSYTRSDWGTVSCAGTTAHETIHDD